jgi:hypothetical protein
MARSKVTTPQGKTLSARKKRDAKNKASISIRSQTTNIDGKPAVEYVKKTKRNDGDPHVYYTRATSNHDSRNHKYLGGTKKITKTKDKKAANPNPGLKGFGGMNMSTKKSEKFSGDHDSSAKRRKTREEQRKVERKYGSSTRIKKDPKKKGKY